MCLFRRSGFNCRGKGSSFQSSQMKFMCFIRHRHACACVRAHKVTFLPREGHGSAPGGLFLPKHHRRLARGRHWLLSSPQSLLCVQMIVSGMGHVCSHVIACFLLKFPCQTLSMFSLSLASYSACQGRPIAAPLARLVSIRGPPWRFPLQAGPPAARLSGARGRNSGL